jgi:hypothetical protein
MGLFSKKPGGTFFGNLLRGAGQAVSNAAGVPGMFGSGANMVPLGGTKTNAEYAADAAKAADSPAPFIMAPAAAPTAAGGGLLPGLSMPALL